MKAKTRSLQHQLLTVAVLCLFIACKYLLRPLHIASALPRFLLGVAPNFFAAVGMPMFAYWNYLAMEKQTFKRYDKWLPFALVIFFAGFVFEEFKPTFANSTTVDVFDILFSGIGISLFFLYYKTSVRKTYFHAA